MPNESWKPIAGYSDYEVSDCGRVRSNGRYVLGRDGRSVWHGAKMLTPWLLKNGYLAATLPNRKKRTVHSLVADAFIGERPKGCDVMHLDGNRCNNHVSNLRYGSRSENLRQTYEYGGRQANGKLFLDQVKEIKKRLGGGEHPYDLAREFGVNNAAIYHIRNGTAYAWVEEEINNAG